jgi:hypothetical protein
VYPLLHYENKRQDQLRMTSLTMQRKKIRTISHGNNGRKASAKMSTRMIMTIIVMAAERRCLILRASSLMICTMVDWLASWSPVVLPHAGAFPPIEFDAVMLIL